MKKLRVLFMSLLCFIFIAACSPGQSSEGNQANAANNEEQKQAENKDEKSPSKLQEIIDKGVIRVGTTGDYKPFTYFNPETEEFEGYDIDAAKILAEDLGVEVEFVKTTWPDLMDDLLEDKFDFAVGGISRNVDRQKTAHLTDAYFDFGKVALIHKKNKDKFKKPEDLNQPDVKVGVNPGGTNKEYVDAHLKDADVTVVEENLDIPGKVAEETFDVMITDTVEADLYAKEDSRFRVAFRDDTLTKSQKGYMMQQGDPIFQNWIDVWMDEMKLNGEFEKLEEEWM